MGNGSIKELFADLLVWYGVSAVIDRINANAVAPYEKQWVRY